ncbi:penicillin-binding protein 1A [Holophaga foetida]|uniref:penicillin-binding protein 1A n=1 Tax=Holophaga foetida TaxID=35839 RepID=UPI000247219A|nr:PBP1A family penicillin-binding protein [Holophaga foetida]
MTKRSSIRPKTSSRLSPLMRRVIWCVLGLGAACLVVLAVAWSWMSRDADAYLEHFALRVPKTITKVLDRNGDTIGIFAEENRVVIPFGDIPKAFVGAVIATEDADFMNHKGVSAKGFVRAFFNFATSFGRRQEGASTLTMQLVRTVTAKREKRLDRKLKEVILALKLEKAYTKKQIFEQYANEVYFGGGRYGIEAAAQFYFGKSAAQLNVEECALLAGLVQSPNYYNPYNADPRARVAAKARRDHVLRRMADEGYLKQADAKLLVEHPIRLAREHATEEAIAPYPVEEIRKYLYEKYGKDKVLGGGLEVHTTIDSVWQQAANEAVRKGLKAVDRRRGFRKESVEFVASPESVQLPGWNRFLEVGDSVRGVILGWRGGSAQVRIGKTTLDVPTSAFAWAGQGVAGSLVRGAAPLFMVKATSSGVPTQVELDQEPSVEGALLAVDHRTGEIRAMVGGYDFNRSKFNRSWQAERQVGSTMKAFVYGAAFGRGMTPATMVDDVPTRFTFGRDLYQPKNYEHNYWGPIPVWEALRDSRNIPAVRTLEAAGIGNVIDFARKAGVQGRMPSVPSLALGSADLTLKDMVRGYATIANGGVQSPSPFLIKKIVDRTGKVLEEHEGVQGEVALDPMSDFQLIQCLQGVAQSGTGARSNELGWPVAGKTGTTDDNTDGWFLGFSTRVTCGVWVGLDAKKTIFRGADGAKVALPIWVDFMKTALQTTPREEFKAPEGMEWVKIDRVTGLRAGGGSDRTLSLAFKPGTAPSAESDAAAVLRVQEAKSQANSGGAEDRPWGTNQLPDPPPPPTPGVNWTNVEDPNK